jgi:tetratricopeptide (TPR) repeat protein
MLKLVQAEFSGIKDTLEEAKAVGIDVESSKARIKEARASFEKKDLEAAHSALRDTRVSLKDMITRFDGIKDKIRRAEELISEAQRSRADVSKQSKALETAKTKFHEGDFDEAEMMLNDLTSAAEKKLAMYLAAKFILASKESIDLGEENGIDVSEAQEMLARAKDLMKAKDYEQALETAKLCSDKAVESITEASKIMVKDLQRLITDAKNVGVDTSGPEVLAEKAVALVRAGDYPEALRCIDSAKNDIDQIKNLSSQAAVEIKVARTNLKDAEKLDMEVGSSRELLDQAVEALTRHQYAIALELAKKSSETSSEVTRNTIWSTLERFKERIDRATSEGASIGTAERCVADGVTAFNDKRYQDALRLAMQCEVEMDRAELQREVGSKAVDMARRKYDEGAEEGISSEAVRRLVSEAEDLLSKGKYVDALSKALESGDELHLIRESIDSARIELSSVTEQVERLRKVGIDTTQCDEMVDMVHEFLSKHEFAKAMDALHRCSEKAVLLFEDSINEVMSLNKDLISRARSMGLTTKPCEDLMEVAMTSFSERLWDFAYQQAQACKGLCIEVISKKIDSLAADAKARLEPLRASGASVRPAEELIEQAKDAAGAGNASEAFQMLMEADQRILGIEDSHRKFIDISIAAESAVEVLRRIGVSTAEAERLLALADLEREKDYDSAIEFVAEALDSAKTMIDSYAPEVVGEVSSSGLQEGSEGEIVIKLKNTGNVLAKEVTVELSGQLKVIGLPAVGSLRPGAEVLVKARVIPDVSGEISIRVNIACRRHFDGAPQSFEFDGSINAFKSGPPYKVTRAVEVAKCAYCEGRIKQGFDVVSCRCGNVLHLACAKRTGVCPVCGQKYTF